MSLTITDKINNCTKALKRNRTEFQKLQKLLIRLQGLIKLECEACYRQHLVQDLIYIQTKWTNDPDRDVWNDGEGQFRCTYCGTVNRLYDKLWITKLKYAFAKIVDEYDD